MKDNSNCSIYPCRKRRALTQYGLMARDHWRTFLPKMVRELESRGELDQMLLEAEEQTERELDQLRRHLIRTGLSPRNAHNQAWEIVRTRYIFLPPET